MPSSSPPLLLLLSLISLSKAAAASSSNFLPLWAEDFCSDPSNLHQNGANVLVRSAVQYSLEITVAENPSSSPSDEEKGKVSMAILCINGDPFVASTSIPIVMQLMAGDGLLQISGAIVWSRGIREQYSFSLLKCLDGKCTMADQSQDDFASMGDAVVERFDIVRGNQVAATEEERQENGLQPLWSESVRAFFANGSLFFGDHAIVQVEKTLKLILLTSNTLQQTNNNNIVVVVDVGANTGQNADFLCSVARKDAVRSFFIEANPLTRGPLVQSIEDAKCNRSIVVSAAVGDQQGEILFFRNLQNDLQSQIVGIVGSGGEEGICAGSASGSCITVPLITLDSFFLGETTSTKATATINNNKEATRRRNKDSDSDDKIQTSSALAKQALHESDGRIDVLLIDTEGFDGHVIRGAKSLLPKTFAVLFECSELMIQNSNVSLRATTEELEESGFDVLMLGTGKNVRIGGQCWNDALEKADWRNCLAVNRRDILYPVVLEALEVKSSVGEGCL